VRYHTDSILTKPYVEQRDIQMKTLAENGTDASKEKHVPVIEKVAGSHVAARAYCDIHGLWRAEA